MYKFKVTKIHDASGSQEGAIEVSPEGYLNHYEADFAL
jgi:hypothetical protein